MIDYNVDMNFDMKCYKFEFNLRERFNKINVFVFWFKLRNFLISFQEKLSLPIRIISSFKINVNQSVLSLFPDNDENIPFENIDFNVCFILHYVHVQCRSVYIYHGFQCIWCACRMIKVITRARVKTELRGHLRYSVQRVDHIVNIVGILHDKIKRVRELPETG